MQEKIREMADLLDAGQKVWFHRQTREVLSHPDPAHYDFDSEYDYLIEEVMDEVMLDFDQYLEIPTLSSTETYKLMEDYADTLLDDRLRRRLFDALGGKKPFKFFRMAIDEADLTDDWYTYRDARLQDYVMSKLETLL